MSNGHPAADETHLAKLHEGVEVWNQWRLDHPEITPNLINASLDGLPLCRANLSDALLHGANLRGATLRSANLQRVKACSIEMDRAQLMGAKLNDAYLKWAHLTKANLRRADLSGANLTWARLDEANITNATLTGCEVYGLSTWGIKGAPKEQLNLVISPIEPSYNEPFEPHPKPVEPFLTVDYLEMAQFIFLLTTYERPHNIIDALTSKVVLVLGRFSDKRKPTLDAVREALRHYNLVPLMFDFDRPSSKTLIETVSTLASMARFVIADFTDPQKVREEAPDVVKNTSVPLQPLLLKGAKKPSTLLDLEASGRTTILPTFVYENDDHLVRSLKEDIIEPVNDKVKEMIALKQKTFEEFDREHKEKSGKRTTSKGLHDAIDIPDQIEKLAKLKERGILTETEFQTKKKELLAKL